MLHGNLHDGRNVVADLLLIDDQGVLPDDSGAFHALDPLGDGGDGQLDLVPDGAGLLSGVVFQTLQNLQIDAVHGVLLFKLKNFPYYNTEIPKFQEVFRIL